MEVAPPWTGKQHEAKPSSPSRMSACRREHKKSSANEEIASGQPEVRRNKLNQLHAVSRFDVVQCKALSEFHSGRGERMAKSADRGEADPGHEGGEE